MHILDMHILYVIIYGQREETITHTQSWFWSHKTKNVTAQYFA